MMAESPILRAVPWTFKNTIIILTLQPRFPYILTASPLMAKSSEEAKNQVNMLFKEQLPSGILKPSGRDRFYKPLTRENIGNIIDPLMNDLKNVLRQNRLSLA